MPPSKLRAIAWGCGLILAASALGCWPSAPGHALLLALGAFVLTGAAGERVLATTRQKLEAQRESLEQATCEAVEVGAELSVANQALQAVAERQTGLCQAALRLGAARTLDEVAERLVSSAAHLLEAPIAYLALRAEEAGSLQIAAALGVPSPLVQHERLPARLDPLVRHILDTGDELRLDAGQTGAPVHRGALLQPRLEATCGVAVTLGTQTVGALVVMAGPERGSYVEADAQLLGVLCTQAAAVIGHLRVTEAQRAMGLSAIQSLVSIIEANDDYTRGHSERVASYCRRIGLELELTPEAMAELATAAILHDIGKVGIHPDVLHKPTPLVGGEVLQMESHPRIGDDILRPMHFLQAERAIIAQHHERFDGKGYPAGRQGEQIALAARIIAVADAYDAMTSNRPYRRALPHEAAVEELQRYAGAQFDPRVVQAFIDATSRFNLHISPMPGPPAPVRVLHAQA